MFLSVEVVDCDPVEVKLTHLLLLLLLLPQLGDTQDDFSQLLSSLTIAGSSLHPVVNSSAGGRRGVDVMKDLTWKKRCYISLGEKVKHQTLQPSAALEPHPAPLTAPPLFSTQTMGRSWRRSWSLCCRTRSWTPPRTSQRFPPGVWGPQRRPAGPVRPSQVGLQESIYYCVVTTIVLDMTVAELLSERNGFRSLKATILTLTSAAANSDSSSTKLLNVFLLFNCRKVKRLVQLHSERQTTVSQ